MAGEINYRFFLQRSDIPQAVKTHRYPDSQKISNITLVFATTSDKLEGSAMKESLARDGFRVGIVQDMETLKQIGVKGWLKIYCDLFRLSSDQLEMMTEYFEQWDKLRQCCGMPMSKLHRNELLPVDQKKEMKPHPFCGSIDPDSLETSFMSAELYKRIDQFPLMRRMNRPATVDGDLDGTYCSRYSNAIREHGIPQNQLGADSSGLNSRYDGIADHFIEETRNSLNRNKASCQWMTPSQTPAPQ